MMENGPFESKALELAAVFREFRRWIDRQPSRNLRFMQAYKKKFEEEIALPLQEFEREFEDQEEGRSDLFKLIKGISSSLRNPMKFMSTDLRPSVGMGVFLERWMSAEAVKKYLKICCREADSRLLELEERIGGHLEEKSK
jgi:hypothetical protein